MPAKGKSKDVGGGHKEKPHGSVKVPESSVHKDRGPLLISIAPMCAGKTTLISELGENNLSDIAIDDAPQVYEKIPLSTLVSLLEPKAPGFEKPAPYVDKKTYGHSTVSRVLESKESEQMVLASLFSGAIGVECAEARLKAGGTSTVLIDVVKAQKNAGAHFTSATIDVFIPEGIPFGVQQYKQKLESAAKNSSGCLVSGNCNVKTQDYSEALTIAYNNKRRVRFIRWGVELAAVPLTELFTRNIARFLKTGRYIPSSKIAEALKQAEAIMAAGSTHSALAEAAGYIMNADGYVYPASASTAEGDVPEVSDSKWASWFSGDDGAVYNIKAGPGWKVSVAAPASVPAAHKAHHAHAAPAQPHNVPAAAAPPRPQAHPATSATEMLKAAVSKIESESSSAPPQQQPAASKPKDKGKEKEKEKDKPKDKAAESEHKRAPAVAAHANKAKEGAAEPLAAAARKKEIPVDHAPIPSALAPEDANSSGFTWHFGLLGVSGAPAPATAHCQDHGHDHGHNHGHAHAHGHGDDKLPSDGNNSPAPAQATSTEGEGKGEGETVIVTVGKGAYSVGEVIVGGTVSGASAVGSFFTSTVPSLFAFSAGKSGNHHEGHHPAGPDGAAGPPPPHGSGRDHAHAPGPATAPVGHHHVESPKKK